MLHILHGADLHLDAPFTGLSAEQARQRRSELRELPRRLAELAGERRADLVLLSGDLFDGSDPYAETAQALSRALGQTGCPVFIAPGNHDPYGPRSPYALLSWPENVHIFQTAAMEAVSLPKLGCTVWGAAFTGVGGYIGYFAGVLFVQFIAGAFWAMAALAFSAYVPNVLWTVCLPLILHRLFLELDAWTNLPTWLNLSLLQDQETELAFAPGLLTAVGIFGALIAIAVLLFYRRGKRRLTYA